MKSLHPLAPRWIWFMNALAYVHVSRGKTWNTCRYIQIWAECRSATWKVHVLHLETPPTGRNSVYRSIYCDIPSFTILGELVRCYGISRPKIVYPYIYGYILLRESIYVYVQSEESVYLDVPTGMYVLYTVHTSTCKYIARMITV